MSFEGYVAEVDLLTEMAKKRPARGGPSDGVFGRGCHNRLTVLLQSLQGQPARVARLESHSRLPHRDSADLNDGQSPIALLG